MTSAGTPSQGLVMGRVEGKVAFITGAARGQGRSHAVVLAREGADIIAADVSHQVETIPYPTATADDLAETVALVESLGRRIVAAEADVRDLDALRDVVDRGVAELGRLDIVIANAGVSSPSSTLDMTEETWATTIDINLTGVWKTVKAAVPHVVASGRGGSVVITSSLAAMKASEHTAHYSASKAGLVGLMRVLAKELAPQSIRVNTIHPTTVNTDMILNDSIYRLFRPRAGGSDPSGLRVGRARDQRPSGRRHRGDRHLQRGPLPRVGRRALRDGHDLRRRRRRRPLDRDPVTGWVASGQVRRKQVARNDVAIARVALHLLEAALRDEIEAVAKRPQQGNRAIRVEPQAIRSVTVHLENDGRAASALSSPLRPAAPTPLRLQRLS